ncbi:MAG TPA: alpha-amylase family glycosyl hydrolase [Pseudonocardia sp.]|nr:alpha-amylase family glycosyl hydrolase [Pseudonocardia sp.]
MQWWRGALVYELDVRSFGDADGDGIGDLDGLRARLGYLELLGVDIVWLEPTPIADRRTVDPLFGDLAAFDALVEAVVELRLRLVADLVRDNGPPQHHRPDRIRLALDRALQSTPFDAAAVQDAVQHSLTTRAETAWSLAHHDVSRAVSRYGGGAAGLTRARSMALVMLALPGTAHVYQGEELGLTDGDLPSEARARVPLPWEGGPPGFGFTTGEPWLPAPAEYGERTVACQLEDTTSTLSLYRRAIELRRTHIPDPAAPLEWYGAPPGCLAFRPEGSALVCALNTSDVPVPLPPGEVLLASGAPPEGATLAPDTAVWLV